MLRWLPEDVSPYGAGIDSLFYLIYYITAAAFILVTALMIIFLYQYRHNDNRRAIYTHGNTSLELVWTIIPALVFIGLGLASKSLWEEIKLTMPETDQVIQITGKQFNWEILYPGPDGEFETGDDYQVDNDIHVPVSKPIRVLLKSRDVIHSLFLPNLRFKQDTMPGRTIEAWFQANKPGKYEMPCAELCGFGHSGMKGWLYADTPEDYAAWFKKRWPDAALNGAPASEAQEEVAAAPSAESNVEAGDQTLGQTIEAAASAAADVQAAGAAPTEAAGEAVAEAAQETTEAAEETVEAAVEQTQEDGDTAAASVEDAVEEAAE